MKQTYLAALCAIGCLQFSPLNAQKPYGKMPAHNHCGTSHICNHQMDHNHALRVEREQLEEFTKEFIANKQHLKRKQYVIPVVFHVHDPSNPQKVTMAQINSAMKILNEDYNALNPDWDEIYPNFKNIAANMNITFALAKKDPQGNPTTGVTYHNNELQGRDDDGKAASHWDCESYLNIWIVNYVEAPNDWADNRSGWSYYPWTAYADAGYDGIVYNHKYLGYAEGSSEVSGPNDPYLSQMARVLSHEVGHYLNLIHPFEGQCNGQNDYVDDTPKIALTWGSGNCEQYYDGSSVQMCPGVTEVNLNNYMDYSHCPSMFTEGQKARALAALNSSVGYRNNLWSLSNLQKTGLEDLVGMEENDNDFFATKLVPNPANERTSIQFGLVHDSEVTISVTNILGQVVKDLKPKTLSQGKHTFDLSVADLRSGLYFVNLETNGVLKTMKLEVK